MHVDDGADPAVSLVYSIVNRSTGNVLRETASETIVEQIKKTVDTNATVLVPAADPPPPSPPAADDRPSHLAFDELRQLQEPLLALQSMSLTYILEELELTPTHFRALDISDYQIAHVWQNELTPAIIDYLDLTDAVQRMKAHQDMYTRFDRADLRL